MSFTLSREGLKPDHYIPVRLRFVDSFGIASGLPLFALVFLVWSHLVQQLKPMIPAAVLRNGAIAFFTVLAPLFFFCLFFIGRFWESLLRVFFKTIGFLNKEEAMYFPLAADKRRCDPWPESWQRKCEPEQNVD